MKRNSNKRSEIETLEHIRMAKKLPPVEAVGALVEYLKKSGPWVGSQAVKALGKIDHPLVVTSLIESYRWAEEDPHKRDRGCAIRQAIVEALGNMETPLAISTLRRAIRTVQIERLGPQIEDSAIGLRATAALALARVDSNALYDLALLLFDENPDIPVNPVERPFVKAPVRKAAAQALGALGDPGGTVVLAIKLRFPQNEVAEVIAECIESIIALRPPYLLEIVKPYLEGVSAEFSAITALALAENLGVEVLDLLGESFCRVPREARESVIVAISAIRSNKTREVLLEFLEHSDPLVRKAAVKGIISYLDEEIKERLQVIHETDPDASVRLAAKLV